MYSSDMDFNHPLTSPEQMAFEPFLLEHGVDLVLVGHEHCYERIHPVVNGNILCSTFGHLRSPFHCFSFPVVVMSMQGR